MNPAVGGGATEVQREVWLKTSFHHLEMAPGPMVPLAFESQKTLFWVCHTSIFSWKIKLK